MIRQLWTLSVHTRAFLRRYMPTNILLDAIRTRRGLKWGVPAMLLAVPYLLRREHLHHPHRRRRTRVAQPPRPPLLVEHDEVHHHGTRQPDPARPRPGTRGRRRSRRTTSIDRAGQASGLTDPCGTATPRRPNRSHTRTAGKPLALPQGPDGTGGLRSRHPPIPHLRRSA